MNNTILPEKTKKMDILVVDDEEIIRDMLQDVLTEYGYKVWTAANGKEALSLFNKKENIGVVITDIRMPDMDGVEVTRKVRSANSNVSVIAITGYASVESAISILKEGAYDYITKPFNIEEIKIIVDRAIERQALLEQSREKEKYKQLSFFDSLTEIYNRRYLDIIIKKELSRAKRYKQSFFFLMADIDYFKNFNDKYGHLAGDWALKKVAQILAGSVRESDYVFRYGGEEFAVLGPETSIQGAVIVAKRLRASVEKTKFLNDKIMPEAALTISMGLAVYPDDADEENLIKKADEYLYQAKALGRNRVCFPGSDKQAG
jgi:diguanylate cyclase (GGDEF)-like protein